jgi:small-conductance mechanosensitive channel
MDSDFQSLAKIGDLFNLGKILLLILGMTLLWFIVHIINKTSERLSEKLPSRRLLVLQVVTVLSFMIYIFGGSVIIYGVLDPTKELLIALGGSAAVAVGLALKDLVSSLVAGLILLFDRPFQVGDRVTFGSTYGEIRSIGLRAVRLVTLDDNIVTIPNARFMTDVVASANAGALDMMVCTDFYVALDADLRLARDLVYEILVTSRYIYLKKPVEVAVNERVLAERLAIELKAKAYVLDVKFEKAFQSDIVLRVEQAFLQKGIPRPLKDPRMTGVNT